MHTHPTGHNITPTFWSCRLVYVTSYLTAVVLFAAYSATFVSFLTARPYRLPFTDFQGLLSNGKYKLGIQMGSTNQNYFQVIIKKVKEPRNRPGVVQRVPGGLGSQISMTFGT